VRHAADRRFDDAGAIAETPDRRDLGEEIAHIAAHMRKPGGGRGKNLAACLDEQHEGAVVQPVLRQEFGKPGLRLADVAAIEDVGCIGKHGRGGCRRKGRGMAGRGLQPSIFAHHAEEMRGGDDGEESDDQRRNGPLQHELGFRQMPKQRFRCRAA
jgi:hypothetical protein